MTGRQFILKKKELELKDKELEIKEKTFLLKKYKIVSDEFLKFNVYPMIGLISILLFKIDKLYGAGLNLVVGLTMFFILTTIMSYFLILFSKSNEEIIEKINGYKNYRFKIAFASLFIFILSFILSWYFAINLQEIVATISQDILNNSKK